MPSPLPRISLTLVLDRSLDVAQIQGDPNRPGWAIFDYWLPEGLHCVVLDCRCLLILSSVEFCELKVFAAIWRIFEKLTNILSFKEYYELVNLIRMNAHRNNLTLFPGTKRFGRLDQVETHLGSVHNSSRYRCPSCPKTFRERYELFRHNRTVHTKDYPFR